MSEALKNGDMVKCSRCNVCHRLTTPKNRRTGAVIPGVLVYVCAEKLLIGFSNGKLSKGLELVEPVGEKAPASENITAKPLKERRRRDS